MSVAATDGAIVEAMDIVLLLSAPFDDAILVVLVWIPGAAESPFGYVWFGYPLDTACSGWVGLEPGSLLFGITLPLMV